MDEKKCDEGTWESYRKGVRLKIARMGGPRFFASLRKHARAARDAKAGEELTAEERLAATKRAVAEVVLVDWEVPPGEDGSKLPYSEEEAFRQLSDPNQWHLYEFVTDTASALDRFEVADQGKSDAGSTGS